MLTAWDYIVATIKWLLLAAAVAALAVWGVDKFDELGASSSPTNEDNPKTAREIMKPPSKTKKW